MSLSVKLVGELAVAMRDIIKKYVEVYGRNWWCLLNDAPCLKFKCKIFSLNCEYREVR